MGPSARVFLDRLQKDTNFYLEIGNAVSKEQRWALIRSHGFQFSAADLDAAKAEMDSAASQKLRGTHIRARGVAEMGDIPSIDTVDGCGKCE